MAVKIRLTRTGRKKAPYYRIVVADSRFQRDGRFLEILGFYHPLKKEGEERFKVNEEQALMWLTRGARPSDTVRSIFSQLGIMKKYHESRQKKKSPEKPSGEQPVVAQA